ncbi:MAG: hypothetical protein ACI38Q_06175 [Candidatus Bruticola sp.]
MQFKVGSGAGAAGNGIGCRAYLKFRLAQMNSFTNSAEIKNRLKRLIGGFRWRSVVMVTVVYLFSFSIVASSVIYFAKIKGEEKISAALVQCIKAFGFIITRDFDASVGQAESLAADSFFDHHRNAANLQQSFETISEKEREELKGNCLTALANLSKDAVVVVDAEGRVCFFVERPAIKEKNLASPAEADFSKEEVAKKEGAEVAAAPKHLDKLDADFFDPVLKFNEAGKGCLRLHDSPSAPLFNAVAVPLIKGKKGNEIGALVLAERIDDKVLAKWSQNMLPGLLVLVSQGKVLSAYDKRSGSRPTPTIAAELDKMIKYWNPRQLLDGTGGANSKFKITSSSVELAGKNWQASAAELASSKKRESTAYLVFLADPANLEQEVRQHIWVLGISLVVTLVIQGVLIYFLSPLCLRFARIHLQAGSAHLASLEAKSRRNSLAVEATAKTSAVKAEEAAPADPS